MPLTPKGKKILSSMKKEYGSKKGKQVFYASQNKGTITGTHEQKVKRGLARLARKNNPKKDGSGGGVRANVGHGGCNPLKYRGRKRG